MLLPFTACLRGSILTNNASQHSVPPPPPVDKYYSEDDRVMLEDESGRIRLVGDKLKEFNVVTGVIMAALGMETESGEFAVVDVCFAGLAPQAKCTVEEESGKMDVDGVYASGDSLFMKC